MRSTERRRDQLTTYLAVEPSWRPMCKGEGPPLGAALLQVRFEARDGLRWPSGTCSRPRRSPAPGVDSATAARTLHAPRRRSRGGGNGRPPSGPAPPASRKVCDSVGPPPFSGPPIEACPSDGREPHPFTAGDRASRRPLLAPRNASTACTTPARRSWTSVHTTAPRGWRSCRDFAISPTRAFGRSRSADGMAELGRVTGHPCVSPTDQRMDGFRTWETRR
jgi:hypothetical protein